MSNKQKVESALVVEFHYDDGDVGAHPAGELEQMLWAHFSDNSAHKPLKIVIRCATPEETEQAND